METLSLNRRSDLNNKSSEYINFMVGGDSYGLDVKDIREVISFDQLIHLTRIPMVHESILGIINLRGEVIPLIDLSMRLYYRKINITKTTCVIIIHAIDLDDRISVGIMIDAVKGVVNINSKDITDVPDYGIKIRREFISKIVTFNNVLTLLLDVETLLNIEELSELAATDIDVNKLQSMKAVKEDELSFKQDSGESDKSRKIAGDDHYFVTFAVESELYGIDMLYIREIINVSKMIRIPNALPFMKGVINLRGKLIPVVDMRERCNLKPREQDNKVPVLIAELDDLLIGLVIDSVNDVIKFPVQKIQYPPHYSAKVDSDFIDGLIQMNNNIIITLNINKVLSPDEKKSISKEDFSKTQNIGA